MVVIESIRAIGFRKLRIEKPLTLQKGLTIIRGRNEAGKSTLIEAILFGLYGDANLPKSFRRPIAGTEHATLDDLIAYNARKAVIEVVFKVEDKRYKVYRVIERRGQSASQVEARLIDLLTNRIIATGVKPVAEEVKKIIGVSWKEMLATNVVAQKDLEHIIQLRRDNREAIINMMMGLESFNKAKDRAIAERRRLNNELEKMERDLENDRELLKDLQDIEKQYEQYSKEKKEIEPKLARLTDSLNKLKPIYEKLKELRPRYVQLQAVLNNRQQDLMDVAEKLRISLETPVNQWRVEIERKAEIPRLTPRQITILIALMAFSVPLFFIIGLPAFLLLLLGVGILGYMYNQVQRGRLQYASVLAMVKNAEEWGREIESYRRELQKLSDQTHAILEELPEYYKEGLEGGIEEAYQSLEKIVNEYGGKVNELKSRLENCEKFIEENKDKVNKLYEVEQEIKRLEEDIYKTEWHIEILITIINSISKISEKLRKSFAPSVEQHMGKILNTITDGRYKAVKIVPETYDIQIFDANIGRFLRRDIYSGGANDQFLLAMRIAFTLSLLRGAKGTYPKFLFLDEPLSSSDSVRRRCILKLLREEMTKHFEQIILITHVEIPEIPNTLLVTMEEGRVVGARRISEIPEEEV